MLKSKLTWLLLLSTFIFACSSNETQNSTPRKLAPIEGDFVFERAWNSFVGFGGNFRDYRLRMSISGDSLFALGKQGRLYALDKNTGSRLWTQQFNKPITAGITIHNNIALLANLEGELFAFDINEKITLWTTSLQSEVLHPPVTNGAIVVVQVNDGTLYAIDINNGDILWTVVTRNPSLTQRGASTPKIINDFVVAGFATGKLIVIHARNGTRIWQSEVGLPKGTNQLDRVVDIDGNIFIENSVIYAAATKGKIIAIDVGNTTPTTLWEKPFSAGSGIIGKNNNIFAIGNNGNVEAFSAKTGIRLWQKNDFLYYQFNNPIIWQDHLVIANEKGYVNALNLNTGDISGRYRVSPYAIQANSLATEQYLYILDNGGFISALEPKQ